MLMAVLDLGRQLHCGARRPPEPGKYEPGAHLMATDREMKVLLVLVIVLLAAATAFAYGHADVAAGVSAVVAQTADVAVSEPATMLLSGTLLLGLASAVRRLSV